MASLFMKKVFLSKILDKQKENNYERLITILNSLLNRNNVDALSTTLPPTGKIIPTHLYLVITDLQQSTFRETWLQSHVASYQTL